MLVPNNITAQVFRVVNIIFFLLMQIHEQIKLALNGDDQQAWTMGEEGCDANLEDWLSVAALYSIAKLGLDEMREDHMATFLGLAARARKSGRHRQALDILESLRAIPQGRASEELAYNLGRVNLSLKRFEEAVQNFKDSLDMLESEEGCDHMYLTSTLFNLALSLQGQGNHDEAVGHLQACLNVHEDHGTHPRHAAKIFMKLGLAYSVMGDKQKSIGCTFKSLELDLANPDKADKDSSLAKDYNHIGDLCFGTGKFHQAAQMYEKSMELQTKPFFVSWLACKLGSSYALCGNHPEAIVHLERGLGLADLSVTKANSEPRYLMNLKTLVKCYKSLSKTAEARVMLESIIERTDSHKVMVEYAKSALESL